MQDGLGSVVDLFCGCGGFGLGAELAGFHSIVGVDIDQDLQSAYTANFPRALTINADVAALDASSWRPILGKGKPDGVIGGPPCQGFSRIGKRQTGDPRNTLIGAFFRQISVLNPNFFIMENVEGILDECNEDVLEAALDTVASQYSIVGPLVVNALDFGAPTGRRRVIVVGYDRAYVDPFSIDDLDIVKSKQTVTVRDAISDLPSPLKGSRLAADYGWASYPKSTKSSLSRYAKLQRRKPRGGIGSETAVKNLARGQTSGFLDTVHSASVRERFSATEQGSIDHVSRYPRLAWEGHCPTLRAGTGSDRGSYQAMRPIHPAEPRVITVREAARLQGFPDWFLFHPTKWHSFRMIGNSVSPPVAKALLSVLRSKSMRDLVA